MFSERVNSSFQHHVGSSLINRNTGYHGYKKKKRNRLCLVKVSVCACVSCLVGMVGELVREELVVCLQIQIYVIDYLIIRPFLFITISQRMC